MESGIVSEMVITDTTCGADRKRRFFFIPNKVLIGKLGDFTSRSTLISANVKEDDGPL
jgi:hypothetical protein